AVPVQADLPADANPIDHFITARLRETELNLQPPADRSVLLRRLRLTITGVPPSPEERAAFLATSDEHGWEDAVHDALQSPAYGERWAQHWLDLARFAETDGFEHDKTRQDAWKYRDWVIEALNADMPYDEFLLRQIAGDELFADDSDGLIATHFCLSGPDMPDINSQEERRHTLLNDLTGTVGASVLGLQVACAECHDHKYDPISQADFYRLRAIFEPAVNVEKNKSLSFLKEKSATAETAHVMVRGDFRRPGLVVDPDVPRITNPGQRPLAIESLDRSTGRRAAFARWLTARDNPLTARVIVNRVWQHHFGVGLSETPSDFGVMGVIPSHPELLDWLALWLMDHGWQLKSLHRLILTSQTWKQRSFLPSGATPSEREAWNAALKSDPKCVLLSRYPRHRLEGEAIRDSMLFVSGLLNEQRGGPGIRPPLPEELRDTLLKNQWDVTEDASQHDRRSIYLFARRNLRYPLFDAFDRPSANLSCPVRSESTTAPQALEQLNSDFSRRVSEALAHRVASGGSTATDQIGLAFRLVLGRSPDPEELTASVDFLEAAADHAVTVDALIPFCLSLLNVSEFLEVE
ncbi:MAG: DUF1553 domain-containing protein, partial [Planctomycetaceae bacterium]|nr:DUF1553 domain-containing protein [Planctomycetaceae bacterium]